MAKKKKQQFENPDDLLDKAISGYVEWLNAFEFVNTATNSELEELLNDEEE